MIKKILAALSLLGASFSAIFFVLMKQAKEERRLERERAENAERDLELNRTIAKEIAEQERANEEKLRKVHNGNDLDSFNAGLELLREQTEKGKKRNASTSST